MTDRDALLEDEERRIQRLRRAVDTAHWALREANITHAEAIEIAQVTREVALQLFPDGGELYDRLCAPRLRRAIEERFGRS
jgi:hypothetical protein